MRTITVSHKEQVIASHEYDEGRSACGLPAVSFSPTLHQTEDGISIGFEAVHHVCDGDCNSIASQAVAHGLRRKNPQTAAILDGIRQRTARKRASEQEADMREIQRLMARVSRRRDEENAWERYRSEMRGESEKRSDSLDA